mmetsp:Transcript_10154/g.23552  ORF Transcript_10154/g.23552 Transcript_10154/m.23552 type:complete len:230 (+) Transcript_10154:217-906(+)
MLHDTLVLVHLRGSRPPRTAMSRYALRLCRHAGALRLRGLRFGSAGAKLTVHVRGLDILVDDVLLWFCNTLVFVDLGGGRPASTWRWPRLGRLSLCFGLRRFSAWRRRSRCNAVRQIGLLAFFQGPSYTEASGNWAWWRRCRCRAASGAGWPFSGVIEEGRCLRRYSGIRHAPSWNGPGRSGTPSTRPRGRPSRGRARPRRARRTSVRTAWSRLGRIGRVALRFRPGLL